MTSNRMWPCERWLLERSRIFLRHRPDDTFLPPGANILPTAAALYIGSVVLFGPGTSGPSGFIPDQRVLLMSLRI